MNETRSRIVTGLDFLFLALVFSLGFMQPSVRIGGFPVQITEILFIATFLASLTAVATQRIRPRFDIIFIFFGVYFLALFSSAIFSESPEFSLIKLIGETYLIGLAVLTFNLVRTEEMIKKTVYVWLAASSIVCLAGLLTIILFYLDRSSFVHTYFLHHYGSLPPGNYPRIQSTFIYPAMLCNYLTVGIILLLAAYRLEWIRAKTFYALFALHIIAAAFTITPGLGGVALGLSIWLSLVLADQGRTVISKLCVAAGITAGLAFWVVSAFTLRVIPSSPYFFDIFGTRIDPTQRLLTWQGAIFTFLDNPVFGKGLGLGVASVFFVAPSGQNQLLTDAHNMWLNIAGQSGFPGLAAITLICVFVVRRSRPFRLVQGVRPTLRVALGVAFVSAFLFQGLIGSFEDARHLWVLIGLIAAITKTDDPTN